MWRWSYADQPISRSRRIFSTYVEVILSSCYRVHDLTNFLHVCGGDPALPTIHLLNCQIFSTYVEVILFCQNVPRHKEYFLHVCGGDPNYVVVAPSQLGFSPRMWRWSRINLWIFQKGAIFSTYVEVIPVLMDILLQETNFLHVCGGDPALTNAVDGKPGFSPRMWRWSCVA